MSPNILFKQGYDLWKVFSQGQGDLSALTLIGYALHLAIPEHVVRD